MIVNTFYRFVYIHIPRTGGVSLSRGLSGLLGHKADTSSGTKHRNWQDFANDIAIHNIKPATFRSFAFVRNPWDRMHSLYRLLLETQPLFIKPPNSFRDFVMAAAAKELWTVGLHSMKRQMDYLIDREGRVRVNFIGHYEYLEADIETIKRELKISFYMPHLNKSKNFKEDYRQHYDDEMVEAVANLFPRDIEFFGYSFDSPQPQIHFNSFLQISACPLSSASKESESQPPPEPGPPLK